MNVPGVRRPSVVVVVAALAVSAALSGAASAGGKGEKGEPQPELKAFSLTNRSDASGSVGVTPKGDVVVAYDVQSGPTALVKVCLLAQTSNGCTHIATLTVPHGDATTNSAPQVLLSKDGHVEILQGACCNDGPTGGDLLFTSPSQGKVFSAPVPVGTLDTTDGYLRRDDAVWSGSSTISGSPGVEVAMTPVDKDGYPARVARISSQVPVHNGISGDGVGGVLVAYDHFASPYTTTVYHSPLVSGPDPTFTYTHAADFPHETFEAISDSWLLTQRDSGSDPLLIREWSGNRFGAPHVVPGTANLGAFAATVVGGGDGLGNVFVSSENGSLPIHLLENTIAPSGVWSGVVDLGSTAHLNIFSGGLNPKTSAGLVVGTSLDRTTRAFPVLQRQTLFINFTKPTVKVGDKAKVTGSMQPVSARKIELQVERGNNTWYDVTSTHETTHGYFSFKFTAKKAGILHYRAMAVDRAHYVMFGYSPSAKLTVHKR
jgi:hypothetical protein